MKRMILMMTVAMALSTAARATPPHNATFNLFGPPAIFDPVKVGRNTSGWEVQLEAMRGLKVAMQAVTFGPGGYSGWHVHPGPVLITVREGTVTFYEEDCSAHIFTAGQGLAETGEHPHFARNETDANATLVVTYLAPLTATQLRIDAPQPPTCFVPQP